MPRGPRTFSLDSALLPARGEFGTILGAETINVGDLFSTPVPLVEGSTIVVEERLSLVCDIFAPSLVGLDKQWFGGKPFLGTYRYSSVEEFSRNAYPIGQEGFLTNLSTDIKAETRYTVVGDPITGTGVFGTLVLDPCNFRISADPKALPTAVGSIVAPEYINKGSSQAFKGTVGIEQFGLGRGVLRPVIQHFGLFLCPGVELVSASLAIAIGGQVQSARVPFDPIPACDTQTSNCKQLEESFFANPNPAAPYRTAGEAAAAALAAAGDGDPDSEFTARVRRFELELAPGCKVTYYGNGILTG